MKARLGEADMTVRPHQVKGVSLDPRRLGFRRPGRHLHGDPPAPTHRTDVAQRRRWAAIHEPLPSPLGQRRETVVLAWPARNPRPAITRAEAAAVSFRESTGAKLDTRMRDRGEQVGAPARRID